MPHSRILTHVDKQFCIANQIDERELKNSLRVTKQTDSNQFWFYSQKFAPKSLLLKKYLESSSPCFQRAMSQLEVGEGSGACKIQWSRARKSVYPSIVDLKSNEIPSLISYLLHIQDLVVMSFASKKNFSQQVVLCSAKNIEREGFSNPYDLIKSIQVMRSNRTKTKTQLN